MSKFGHLSDKDGERKITDHFRVKEVWCTCCQRLPEDPLLFYHMDKLEELRDHVRFALIINSGYRCYVHNKAVGGADDSMHLRIATDVRDVSRQAWALDQIAQAAEDLGAGGIGRYTSFVHLDWRNFLGKNVARWSG